MDAVDVADAIAGSVLRRFVSAPSDPLTVLVGCFEADHRAAVEEAMERHVTRLFEVGLEETHAEPLA